MSSTTTPLGARSALLVAALFAGALWMIAPSTARAESPINGNVDLHFGPYYPNIDQEFDGSEQPFEDTFGSNNRVMAQLDALYYVWKRHGKLGFGATLGYVRFNGDAQIQGGGSNGGDSGGDDVNLQEETRFNVFPLGLIGAYRWDYPSEQWGIPLAARAEVGLDYYLWRIADESGSTIDSGNLNGSGGTPGGHLTLRGELLLDWIDPKSAAQFDYSWGVNNTYFFWEYTFSRVRDFDGEGFRLGDNFWRMGLAFEF